MCLLMSVCWVFAHSCSPAEGLLLLLSTNKELEAGATGDHHALPSSSPSPPFSTQQPGQEVRSFFLRGVCVCHRLLLPIVMATESADTMVLAFFFLLSLKTLFWLKSISEPLAATAGEFDQDATKNTSSCVSAGASDITSCLDKWTLILWSAALLPGQFASFFLNTVCSHPFTSEAINRLKIYSCSALSSSSCKVHSLWWVCKLVLLD